MAKEPEDKKGADKNVPLDTRRAYSIEDAPDEHLAMLEHALGKRLQSSPKKSGCE